MCNTSNWDCILHSCDSCPNLNEVEKYLKKYFKNIANLNYHYMDYELKAEWHFFATSHGRSPCDGIGGTVKHSLARASLQNTSILDINEMYEWSASHIDDIKFFKVTESDVERHFDTFDLEKRYSQKYNGIQFHHSFIPKDGALKMHRVSSDDDYTEIILENQQNLQCDDIDVFKPGMYAAHVYDNKWYIGNILEVSKEFRDAFVHFMKTGKKFHMAIEKRPIVGTDYQCNLHIITAFFASCHVA